MSWLVSLGVQATHQPQFWLLHGDIALGSITFHMDSAVGPDGKPMPMEGTTAEVIRRQPDGTWKYLVDHPFAYAS